MQEEAKAYKSLTDFSTDILFISKHRHFDKLQHTFKQWSKNEILEER